MATEFVPFKCWTRHDDFIKKLDVQKSAATSEQGLDHVGNNSHVKS